MKKLTFIYILLFNLFALGQDLPMKNGLMYYKFENKLENKKKCLKDYLAETYKLAFFDRQLKSNVLASNTKNLSLFKEFLGKNVERNMAVSIPGGSRTDTLDGGLFLLGLPPRAAKIYEYIGAYQIATVFKDKPSMQMINGNLSIIFINKNQYILRIKGLVLTTYFTSGKVENLPLGKIYEAFQKDEKKSKEMINMFNYLDASIKDFDTILKDTIIEIYTEDEID